MARVECSARGSCNVIGISVSTTYYCVLLMIILTIILWIILRPEEETCMTWSCLASTPWTRSASARPTADLRVVVFGESKLNCLCNWMLFAMLLTLCVCLVDST